MRCDREPAVNEDLNDSEVSAADRRRFWELGVLVAMYAGYVAFMLCRNTLQAASAAMIADPALGLDKEKFGRLMSLHSAGAIGGMLVMGPAADRFGGRATFLFCLLFTSLSCAAFGLGTGLTYFMVWNFLGQFFKSGGWASMAKIIGAWYPSSRYGRIWSIISTSSRVGTIAAGVVLGFLLLRVNWRVVFFVSSLIGIGAVALGFFFLKARPADVRLGPPGPKAKGHGGMKPALHPLDALDFWPAVVIMARSARVWLIFAALALLTVLMDFINFLPIYIRETLKVEPGVAAMAGSIFPAGMFVSLLVCGVGYDRVGKRGQVGLHAGLLATSIACVLALQFLPGLGLAPGPALVCALAAVALLGFTIAPSYYLPMSVFAIEFGGRHSGFLIAMIDVFGYLGAMVFNYFGGSIAQHHGWPAFLRVLLVVAGSSLAVMTAFLALDALHDRRHDEKALKMT